MSYLVSCFSLYTLLLGINSILARNAIVVAATQVCVNVSSLNDCDKDTGYKCSKLKQNIEAILISLSAKALGRFFIGLRFVAHTHREPAPRVPRGGSGTLQEHTSTVSEWEEWTSSV